MPLFTAPINVPLKIVEIRGGFGIKRRLFAYGFAPGDTIIIRGFTPFRTTFHIENLSNGVRIAIGRGMAKHILVREAIL